MILIIDDDYFNRAILSNIFSSRHEIIEAENGTEGLKKVEEYRDRLSAIFLDMVMPDIDGIGVLKVLDKHNVPKEVPIFLITAHVDNDILKTAYSLGVMDVISKPVLPFVISRRVESIVELFDARKSLHNTIIDQKHELYEKTTKIENLNHGMLEALATTIEFRDIESGEHVRHIYDITKYLLSYTPLGKGLTLDEIEAIALASIMHDVGKIAIPDAILNKPGKLTPEEFEIMKTHSMQGAKLLENIPQLHDNDSYKYAYDIARHHHERWDGNGYPDKLKGDEITIWAQIVSLADVYDALTSKRVYKSAFTAERAVEMIRDGECGIFNPELLKYFLDAEPNLRKLYER